MEELAFFILRIKKWESDYEKCKDLHFTYKMIVCKSYSVKIMRETKQKQSLHVPVLSCRLDVCECL